MKDEPIMRGAKTASFVMAGGGTGGHVMPALAVARELRARGHAVRFIGTRRGMEAKLVPAEGFPIEWIEIGGLKRVGLRTNAVHAGGAAVQRVDRLPACSIALVPRRFSPWEDSWRDPCLLAALWKHVPVVVMEPNAVPGFTHRKLARFVSRALVSFPRRRGGFRRAVAEVTGLPVREEFFRDPAQPRGRQVDGA